MGANEGRQRVYFYEYLDSLSSSVKESIQQFILQFEKFILESNLSTLSAINQDLLKQFSFPANLMKGGNQVVKVMNFSISPNHKFVIKFYDISLTEIIMHCLSIEEFYARNSPLSRNYLGIDIQMRVMNAYGVGKMQVGSHWFTYLIQEFNHFKPYYQLLRDNYTLTIQLNKIFTEIAKNGFIIDPSPTNWFAEMSPNEDMLTLDYIDLVFFNDPVLLQRSSELANMIEKDLYSDTSTL
ncbi:MAG: hypothetical protein ACXAD7_25100 [Candidatus Kariarchaeaceae archaeon]|jgi:hypothetical protein